MRFNAWLRPLTVSLAVLILPSPAAAHRLLPHEMRDVGMERVFEERDNVSVPVSDVPLVQIGPRVGIGELLRHARYLRSGVPLVEDDLVSENPDGILFACGLGPGRTYRTWGLTREHWLTCPTVHHEHWLIAGHVYRIPGEHRPTEAERLATAGIVIRHRDEEIARLREEKRVLRGLVVQANGIIRETNTHLLQWAIHARALEDQLRRQYAYEAELRRWWGWMAWYAGMAGLLVAGAIGAWLLLREQRRHDVTRKSLRQLEQRHIELHEAHEHADVRQVMQSGRQIGGQYAVSERISTRLEDAKQEIRRLHEAGGSIIRWASKELVEQSTQASAVANLRARIQSAYRRLGELTLAIKISDAKKLTTDAMYHASIQQADMLQTLEIEKAMQLDIDKRRKLEDEREDVRRQLAGDFEAATGVPFELEKVLPEMTDLVDRAQTLAADAMAEPAVGKSLQRQHETAMADLHAEIGRLQKALAEANERNAQLAITCAEDGSSSEEAWGAGMELNGIGPKREPSLLAFGTALIKVNDLFYDHAGARRDPKAILELDELTHDELLLFLNLTVRCAPCAREGRDAVTVFVGNARGHEAKSHPTRVRGSRIRRETGRPPPSRVP